MSLKSCRIHEIINHKITTLFIAMWSLWWTFSSLSFFVFHSLLQLQQFISIHTARIVDNIAREKNFSFKSTVKQTALNCLIRSRRYLKVSFFCHLRDSNLIFKRTRLGRLPNFIAWRLPKENNLFQNKVVNF